ncbi:ricin-type beta-trefoil lectin domain protein [Streptomyces sp. CC219B]|uniref:ricin-type beta-trefoil lectin domain protein n=1 Tax=Streptomyces sp. CC219B TaxID=3044574 RepID=UPI0024A9AA5E|nr:ricin-type beta-trefoil lectin domain protein [Streptomyces sp. CC219B]
MHDAGLSNSPDTTNLFDVTDAQLSAELKKWTGASPALHPVGELLDRHWEAGFAYARLCTADARSAGMLTTAAFTRLFGETLRQTGPTSAWRPHLLVTVRRIAAEWDTDQRRELLHPDLTSGTDGERAAARLLPPAHLRLLSGAFQRLPQSARCVLWHTEVEAEPLRVPAGLLGLDEEGARLELGRARDRLREECLQLHRELAPEQDCRRYLRLLDVTYRRGGADVDPDLRDHLTHCRHCRPTAEQLDRFNHALGPALAEAVLGWGAQAYVVSRTVVDEAETEAAPAVLAGEDFGADTETAPAAGTGAGAGTGIGAGAGPAAAGPTAAAPPTGPAPADGAESDPWAGFGGDAARSAAGAESDPWAGFSGDAARSAAGPGTGMGPGFGGDAAARAAAGTESGPGPGFRGGDAAQSAAGAESGPWAGFGADAARTAAGPEADLGSGSRGGDAARTDAGPESGGRARLRRRDRARPESGPGTGPRRSDPARAEFGAEPGPESSPRPGRRRDPARVASGGGPAPTGRSAQRTARRAARRRNLTAAVSTVAALVVVPLVLWSALGPADDTGAAEGERPTEASGSGDAASADPSWAGAEEAAQGTLTGRLYNLSSGLCVGVVGGKAVKDAETELAKCSGQAGQQWSYETDGLIRSVADPGLCLDSRLGYSVRLAPCADASASAARNVRYDFTLRGALVPRWNQDLALTPAATDGSGALVVKTRADRSREESAAQRWVVDTSKPELQLEVVNWAVPEETPSAAPAPGPSRTSAPTPTPKRSTPQPTPTTQAPTPTPCYGYWCSWEGNGDSGYGPGPGPGFGYGGGWR